jgi:hypothetical protein
MRDDTMHGTLTASLMRELEWLVDRLATTPDLDLATAEGTVRVRLHALGGRLLDAGLTGRSLGVRLWRPGGD